MQHPGSAAGRQAVTNIEACQQMGTHPVQRAWIDLDVRNAALQIRHVLNERLRCVTNTNPTDAEIDAGKVTNACRCRTYTAYQGRST